MFRLTKFVGITHSVNTFHVFVSLIRRFYTLCMKGERSSNVKESLSVLLFIYWCYTLSYVIYLFQVPGRVTSLPFYVLYLNLNPESSFPPLLH